MSENDFSFCSFKKLDISPKCARKIAHIQSSFERFSNHLMKLSRENKESTQGLIRMQEACVWFCRSVAMMSAYDIYRKNKILEEELLAKKEEFLEEEGDDIGNKEPIIVIKKKKVFIKKK